MTTKEFNKGDVIFKEGTLGECLYEIQEGEVSVFSGYGTEHEHKIADIGKGGIFGEMALLEFWPRTATVVAEADGTKVLEFASSEVNEFFENNPQQIRQLMTTLSSRLRKQDEEYLEACQTLKEMEETKKENRSTGLLSRITKFFTQYSNSYAASAHYYDEYEKLPKLENVYHPKESEFESKHKEGSIIFREGDPADCMYLVEVGDVGIYTDYSTIKQKELAVISTDQIFGEMGIFEKLPRNATAVVLTDDTWLHRITADNLDQLINENPKVVLQALSQLSYKLRRLTTAYIKKVEEIAKTAE